MAPIALEHELMITHGNGPQVGLLALQSAAYKADEIYPLDILDAETEGMIGYLIEQELINLLPPDHRCATLLTQIEVAPDDPAFKHPSKPIGPVYDSGGCAALNRFRGHSYFCGGLLFGKTAAGRLGGDAALRSGQQVVEWSSAEHLGQPHATDCRH